MRTLASDDIDVAEIQNPSQEEINFQQRTKSCIPICVKDKVDVKFQGWRKWCIFGILLFLIFIVMINLGLTLWILAVMKFHKDGMGQLKITSDGIQLSGKAIFLDDLITSSIKTPKNTPLTLESNENFTIRTSNENGDFTNQIYIDKNKLECRGTKFVIKDDTDKLLFSANSEEVVVGVDTLKINGNGGVVFEKSLNTPLVRADISKNLTLQSLTRSMNIEAPNGIFMESKAGAIDVKSLRTIKLRSTRGTIDLSGSNVIIRQLQKASPEITPYKSRFKMKKYDVFQLCICGNGRLFLANAYGICETFDSDLICA